MGQGKSAAITWHRRGFDFQGQWILYHRLPKRGLQAGCQEGRVTGRRGTKARGEEAIGALQTREILDGVKTLECAQCGHHNDPTRVFCQNCGARLERPAGDEPRISGPTKVVLEKRHRGRAAGTGMIGAIFGLIRMVLGTAIFAALLALVIQMARQPDGVPPAQPANEAQAGQLLQAVQDLAGSTYARTIDITESQANNYLKSSIVPDEEGAAKFLRANFSRAFVDIRSGELDFLVEQIFYGWPIYMRLTTVPDTSGGRLSLRVTGGGIGRMPLNDRLVPLLERALRPVIASTSQAAAVLETVDGVVLSPSLAKLSWNARKSPAQ